MGNLVFQATLGGQVNLVGPNTASTFNLNVPAVAGTLVTTGDTGTVTNTMLASSAYTAPGTIGSGTPNTGAFTTLSASGVASFAAGSAAAPALTRTGDTNTGIFFPAADTIAFAEGGVEAMRLDSSGNMGLGVTPSATSVANVMMQMKGGAVYSSNSTNMKVLGNAFFNGTNFIYQSNGFASQYSQGDGVGAHSWHTAASGTAGNAISFTQAMTLDASGNLIIGGTTAYGKTTVSGTLPFLRVVDTAGSSGVWGSYISGASTDLVAFTYSSVTGENRIGGLQSYVFPTFYSGGSERARIDSSGVLLVGTTSAGATPSAKLQIGGDSTSSRVLPRTDNTGYVGDSGQRWQAIYAVNGTIQTSDGREKNTIEDSNLGLSFVQSLRPVSYKWNVGENLVTYDEQGNEVVTPRSGARTHYGFIAQEVKQAIPSGVDFGGFVEEPNDGPMSLRYHEFIGPLVKAIQELKTIVDAQAVEIAALKGQA